MLSSRLLWSTFLVALLAGCAREAPPAHPLPPTPYRSAGGNDEIRRLLLDAATSGVLCEQLANKFLPLPDQSAPVPLEAPAAGRWWIQTCRASSAGPELAIQLAGPAWSSVGIAWRTADRAGAAPAGLLTATAARIRRTEAAQIEARIQRAGVLLVLPLGLCFLPGFLLTTVVPVVADLVTRVL